MRSAEAGRDLSAQEAINREAVQQTRYISASLSIAFVRKSLKP